MDRTIGPYQIAESLGAHPLGELQAATHPARTGQLALLLLHDALGREHRFRGLLRLEVARAGGLRHPAVARPVEVGEQRGRLFVVFERPAGQQPLDGQLAAGAPLPAEQGAVLARRLGEALDAAHARRLVHGLLGPGTVLVGPAGATLVGLGLVAAVDDAGLADAVRAGLDPAWLAPEQARGRLAVASADGYALGVLARVALADLTPAAAAIVDRQTAASPSARYPSCTAFADALATALAPEAAGTAVAESPLRPAEPPLQAAATVQPAPPPSSPPKPPRPSGPTRPPEPARPPEPPPVVPTALPNAPAPPDVPATSARATERRESAAQAAPTTGRTATREPEVDVATFPPTPAMLACLKRLERDDPLGDLVRWLANRSPLVDRLVARVSRDGKVGPLPAGVAGALALAVLVLVLGAPLLSAVIVAIVAVIYVMPRLAERLTASEVKPLEAVRVTGPAHVRPHQHGWPGGELQLSNGVSVRLDEGAYERLTAAARPIVVEQPSATTMGTETVVRYHILDRTTVRYLATNRLLFDVRGPDGSILHRHAAYAGEPGDPAPASSPRPARTTPLWGSAVDRPNLPDLDGERVSTLPTSPAVREALRRALRERLVVAGASLGLPLLVVVFSYGSSASFFAVSLLAFFAVMTGLPALDRALTLRNVRTDSPLVRVVGTARLTSHRLGKSNLYRLSIPGVVTLKLDGGVHAQLARAARPIYVEEPGVRTGSSWNEELQSEHELADVRVIYQPDAPLLLAVSDPAGAVLYADPATAHLRLHEAQTPPGPAASPTTA